MCEEQVLERPHFEIHFGLVAYELIENVRH